MSDSRCNETEIRALLFHAERMVLWQSVEAWDDNSLSCSTSTHNDVKNPLRRDGALSSIHLAEYGAQMMAIHGALLVRKNTGGTLAPGVLTSLKDFEMHVPRIDDISAVLTGTAKVLISGASGSIYEFSIDAGDRRVASGRVSVLTLPGATTST
ncbi:phosphotransferase [Stenotrophobium rhamnosiphilum]|uniref:phosphotransferase n=1 Tax=Stenotrophobium rhamnosiphilum TaxID=2029166 RepID=UPI0011B28002|nr:phosphotransferase [Stenotrophobium rhamnosiphilum]